MKKHAVAGLLAGLTVTGAHAQSSVVLYGSLNEGLGYVSNVAGGKKFFVDAGDVQSDRWGLTGREDLGGGMRAVFKLENGFTTNNGASLSATTLWNRQAYVGIGSDQWGTVTLGSQTPPSFDYLTRFSTANNSGSFFAFHLGNLDQMADTPTVPYNNAIKYTSTSYYGLSFGTVLSLGNTTNFAQGRNVGVGLSYQRGAFSAGAVYQNEHNRATALPATDFSTFQGKPSVAYLADQLEETGAGFSYQFQKVLVHALYTRVRLESGAQHDTFQSYDAGVDYRVVPFDSINVGGAVTTLAGHHYTQASLGDIYSFSKSTDLYLNLNYEHASGAGARAALFTAGVASGSNQLLIATGIHHLF
jgi:predicted porin